MYRVDEGAGSQNRVCTEWVRVQDVCGKVRLREATGKVCFIWSAYMLRVNRSSTGATEI